MKLLEFLCMYGNQATIISKLQQEGLVRTEMVCITCGQLMRVRKSDKRDGIMFECSKGSCRTNKSLRIGSFFENARLSLCDCMILIHLWSKEYSERLILEDFKYSNKTIIDWFRYCRELCVYYFEENQDRIGGPGTVIEIDETHVVKRKYNRGRLLESGWLFGGIERRDDGRFKAFFRLVYNRSGPHLKHLIREHVVEGTHIITDGWAGYTGLSEIGYQHSVIIHDDNFVSPIDRDVHTQKIEATWGSLKRFLRSHGTNKGEFLAEYICEYIFRRMNNDVFEALLSVIRSKYPISQ